jgi:hypothetical protein
VLDQPLGSSAPPSSVELGSRHDPGAHPSGRHLVGFGRERREDQIAAELESEAVGRPRSAAGSSPTVLSPVRQ